jgi:hypothetical protein
MHVRHVSQQTVNWLPIACRCLCSVQYKDGGVLPSHDGRLSFGRARNGLLSSKRWSSLIRRVLAVGTRCSDKTISLPSRLSASVSVTFMAVIDVTETSVISEPNQSRLDVLSPIQSKLEGFPLYTVIIISCIKSNKSPFVRQFYQNKNLHTEGFVEALTNIRQNRERMAYRCEHLTARLNTSLVTAIVSWQRRRATTTPLDPVRDPLPRCRRYFSWMTASPQSEDGGGEGMESGLFHTWQPRWGLQFFVF